MQHTHFTTSPASSVPALHSQDAAVQPKLSLGRQTWHFTRHYLEMCAAMCLGGTALNLLVFVGGPAVMGYPDLRHDAPALALVLAAVLYTLPMTVWMRIRHMAWRPTLEMSAASVVVAGVVAALFGSGVMSRTGLDGWLAAACFPWCVVMFVVMLFRLPLYTGRSGHQHG
jgi:hypothetical protein